jgi:hypothetical protein
MDTILDTLIYRAEDTTVEFKCEQYVIAKPPKEEGVLPADAKRAYEAKKSELLKDVLAMANAWRDGSGYIVIGAREGKGGPAEVIGLPDNALFDDAVIQQFIGSKLAHALQFTYAVIDYQGKKVGLITIPKQNGRPFYAKEGYGVVQAEVVYVRRGSSTATADPTEIARMGRDEVSSPKVGDVIFVVTDELGVALPATKRGLTIRDFGEIDKLEDYSESNAFNQLLIQINGTNRDFYREMAEALHMRSCAVMVKVALLNRSTYALRDCKLDLLVADKHGRPIELKKMHEFPDFPRRRNNWMGHRIPDFGPIGRRTESMDVEGMGRCVFRFDLVRPGETVHSPETFAVMPSESTGICFAFRLLSGDLPQPVTYECQFDLVVEREHWDVKRLEHELSRRPVEESED